MANVLNRTTKQYLKSVNTPDFPTASWIINPDLTAVAGVPSKFWKIIGDVVSEMSSAEKDTADLTNVKAAKFEAIDLKTGELIAVGFTYSGKVFSLSIEAQAKMIGAHQLKDDPAFTYPVTWGTLTDDSSVVLDDASDLHNFYLTGVGTIRVHLDGATPLKASVAAATTIGAVDAVVDPR